MDIKFIQPLVVRNKTAVMAIGRVVGLPAVPEVGDHAHDVSLAPTLIVRIRVNLEKKQYECVIDDLPFEDEHTMKEFLNNLPEKRPGWNILCARN